MLKTTERIIPLTDLQNDLPSVLRNAQKQPLVITTDGRPVVYMLSVEMFDYLVSLFEFEASDIASNIAIGEQQFQQGAFLTLQEAIGVAETRWQAQESLYHEQP